MRTSLRHAGLMLACLWSIATVAQDIHVVLDTTTVEFLGVRALREGTVNVPGQGKEVPGISLTRDGSSLHAFGDDSTWCHRSLADSAWSDLLSTLDSVVPGATVHWVRFRVLPEVELKGVPILLNLHARGAYTVFLNGEERFRSMAVPGSLDRSAMMPWDSVSRSGIPIQLACDGAVEVLAIRLLMPPGEPLRSAGLIATLHTTDSSYAMQRSMLHFGVFVGINVILLMFSLVLWSLERGDRNWLLLALLSFVSALGTICELGGSDEALGFTPGVVTMLGAIGIVITPWPMYLLIMVLGRLRGDLSAKRARWYTGGVVVVTVLCALFVVAEALGLADLTEGLSFLELSPWYIVAVLFAVLTFGLIVAWFAIEVIRLGIRLLRAKGYQRWVGAGAVASMLLTLVLMLVSELAGVGLASWLSVLGDYCSYVAVPVSIAVYLAIRSAHHNRLVSRQRDELDAEVKERTAELRAEKERSDELLLNILPHEVAEELKDKGTAAAKHFDQATVLFTDFRGFTQLSEQVGPAELVQELNTCFKVFDGLMGKYRIEKIKTIGDAYMATGGLPDTAHGRPVDVLRAALEMQDFMLQHKAERVAQGKPFFEMRVGIHSGPVVAGIVGVKKFQYDIWGDTVNTASRMESSGEIGRVNISEATYRLVKDEPGFAFIPRGQVAAKGKGDMAMFFVERV